MKHLFVPYDLAVKLKEKGYDEPCFGRWEYFDIINRLGVKLTQTNTSSQNTFSWQICSAPLYQQVIDWLDTKGYNIKITPEYYTEGINWNWQVFWYVPKEDWTDWVITDGTMMYGDNGEYNTRIEAMHASIEHILNNII